MKKKLFASILIIALLMTIGITNAFASATYSGYLKYVHTNYYYYMCTDNALGYPSKFRNNCTTHTPNTSNSAWKVRCACHNGDITTVKWQKLGDKTHYYDDYEHYLTGQKLLARPNSNVSGVTVGGTFWGRKS